MQMKHMIIEGYCDGVKDNNQKKYPCKNTLTMGTYCLECREFSYAACPDEIALSNASGIVETLDDFVGFGGDMEPDDINQRDNWLKLWRSICIEKIREAYHEYIKELG